MSHPGQGWISLILASGTSSLSPIPLTFNHHHPQEWRRNFPPICSRHRLAHGWRRYFLLPRLPGLPELQVIPSPDFCPDHQNHWFNHFFLSSWPLSYFRPFPFSLRLLGEITSLIFFSPKLFLKSLLMGNNGSCLTPCQFILHNTAKIFLKCKLDHVNSRLKTHDILLNSSLLIPSVILPKLQ